MKKGEQWETLFSIIKNIIFYNENLSYIATAYRTLDNNDGEQAHKKEKHI